ncbi:hypothetical protein ACMGGS_19300 [Superficieibacter sp. BNK-5]|uniref:hypothetical protein n=1 Tax=Superficieibacter sp. BNK-5 TaxID=3376142 RepID=UPI0039BF0990
MALAPVPDNAGWRLRLTRPAPTTLAGYTMIVGPVSAAPPGIRGTALTPVPDILAAHLVR